MSSVQPSLTDALPTTLADQGVVLFDGVCSLCNASVDLIIKRDHAKHFRFASLQSEAAQKVLAKHSQAVTLDSIVLVESDQVFTESTAALRIARHLGWMWAWLYLLIIIPRFVRDPLYRLIARNRYRWFGKKDTCRVPTPEERALFLQ